MKHLGNELSLWRHIYNTTTMNNIQQILCSVRSKHVEAKKKKHVEACVKPKTLGNFPICMFSGILGLRGRAWTYQYLYCEGSPFLLGIWRTSSTSSAEQRLLLRRESVICHFLGDRILGNLIPNPFTRRVHQLCNGFPDIPHLVSFYYFWGT